MVVSCILVGAGKGTRLGLSSGKAFLEINSRPLVVLTMEKFLRQRQIKQMILVVRREDLRKARQVVKKFFPTKDIDIVPGGATRSQSVRNGLAKVSDFSEYVMVHDVARVLVREKEIQALLRHVKKQRCCALGSRASKTLKRTRKNAKGYRIVEHVQRNDLFEIHTPQVFERKVLQKAYEKSFSKDALDSSQVCGKAGYTVYIVPGSSDNIKITYPQDLVFAREVLR